MKSQLLPVMCALALGAGLGFGQPPAAGQAKPQVRRWTSAAGQVLSAEYLGVQGVNVVLKLADGKITPIALVKLSEADNAYVKQNDLEYSEPGQAKPADEQVAIHDPTHLFTHDMLDNLPIWLNDGYAAYIRSIPTENGSFKVGKDKLRQGVLDSMVGYDEKHNSHRHNPTAKLKGADRRESLQGDQLPKLVHVAKVLKMTDPQWVSENSPGASAASTPFGAPQRLPRLYLTANLIVYYFIQIEGEAGVAKIRRFLELNRKQLALYHEYLAAYKTFEEQKAAFVKLPGVTQLEDGRFRYPSNLVLPQAPDPPCPDPNALKSAGLEALLGGETAEVVGQRIEAALNQDLGLHLAFVAE